MVYVNSNKKIVIKKSLWKDGNGIEKIIDERNTSVIKCA